MQLVLTRYNLTEKSSIGRIVVDGEEKYTSLEPVMRQVAGKPVSEWKIDGKTAIPTGTYEIDMLMSAHFGVKTPHILNVEDFEAVEMHVGNWPINTKGCVLVGMISGADYIGRSKEACQELYAAVTAAKGRGKKVFITISNYSPL